MNNNTNWQKFILLLIIVGVVLLVLYLMWNSKVQTLEKISKAPIPTVFDQDSESVQIKGIMRTAGFMDTGTKERMGIGRAVYQITDLENKVNGKDGFFLMGADNSKLAEFEGKCVTIEGKTDTIKSDDFDYNRGTMTVNSISQNDYGECRYQGRWEAGKQADQKKIVEGIVWRAERPAPDIGYDYALELSKPFVDENSSAGGPVEIKRIDMVALSQDQWIILEENVGKKVKIEGYYLWGYAESKYLEIEKISIK